MSNFLLKTLQIVLGFMLIVASSSGCSKGEPAVAKVSPEEARPGATLTIAGKGLSNFVRVGEVEVRVKSRRADSLLVVELPKKLKPGNYNLIVTDQGTKISSKPVKVRILDKLTVPAGTPLKVRVVESISSRQSQVGDIFRLSLDQPLIINGQTVANEGSEILGKVIQVEDAGREKGRALIEFTLIQLKPGKLIYSLVTDNFFSQTQNTKKRKAITIKEGTGGGASTRGILNDKKGAIDFGGTANTEAVLATKGKEIAIPSGSLFSFLLNQPLEMR